MKRRALAVACIVWVTSTIVGVPQAASPERQVLRAPSPASPDFRGVVTQYCITCHNQRLKTAGLALDGLDFGDIAADAEVWEKVLRKVDAGMMPPAGVPRPDKATHDALISSLEMALDGAAARNPNPGRALPHRLNRAEYANAIRDLLALEIDVASLLPPDDSGYGFDNITDMLGVSPELLERYLAAAGRISAWAVGDIATPPGSDVFKVRQDRSQDKHIDGLPLGTVGGVLLRRWIPVDGEYVIQARLFRTNLGTMRGLEYRNQMEFTVDGERVHLAEFGGNEEVVASSDNPTLTGDAVDARLVTRLRLKAGPRDIGLAFIEKTAAKNSRRLQPWIRSSADTVDFSGYPHIDTVTITGPFNATGVGSTPSRRRIFTCRPETQAEEAPCARRIVETLARRAYRGDLTEAEVEGLLGFYRTGRQQGDFDAGIELALRRILASPKFVFRVERDPANAAPGTVHRLTDLELASRLSFFLWSSVPDDELLDLAGRGRLSTPSTLEAQVQRMLADPRSAALVSNFAGQWLYVRNLKSRQPHSGEFPDFDDNLREAFQRETELFFESIIREDRSVIDLLTADHTFVDERLAKHYGIPNVYGSQFRRVTLTDEARNGLLGKGSILMVTSHAHRTSPVLRGKWVLENLLGAPPPSPPEDVPPFPEAEYGEEPRSVRERLAQHRANPACSGCHQLMDPIGLALENFDAVGAWRARDGGTRGTPVDASGQLLDGTQVNGPVELRQALLRRPETFVRTVTEKLLLYALGRGLRYYDMPAVRRITRDAAAADYRVSALVAGIVTSTPFQMRITALPPDSSTAH